MIACDPVVVEEAISGFDRSPAKQTLWDGGLGSINESLDQQGESAIKALVAEVSVLEFSLCPSH